jgi:hypothetical protein
VYVSRITATEFCRPEIFPIAICQDLTEIMLNAVQIVLAGGMYIPPEALRATVLAQYLPRPRDLPGTRRWPCLTICTLANDLHINLELPLSPAGADRAPGREFPR